ncbi:hypothetical protein ZWY2020_009846 [Hordeum vulgare]|nr:hypothetical protein ZWY2020_009846 [Hordeum vulgare]
MRKRFPPLPTEAERPTHPPIPRQCRRRRTQWVPVLHVLGGVGFWSKKQERARRGQEVRSSRMKPVAVKKKGPVDPNNLRGIMRLVPVSDALSKFGGAPNISRSGVL